MSAKSALEGLAQEDRQLQLIPHAIRDGSWRERNGEGGTSKYELGFGMSASALGIDTGIMLTAPAGRTAGGMLPVAGFETFFYGRAIGLLVWRRFGGATPDVLNLSVKVDRRMYSTHDLRSRWSNGEGFSLTSDGMGAILFDTDLPPTPDGRPHVLEVNLAGNPEAGALERHAYIFGLIVDKLSGGYVEQPRMGTLMDVVTVPALTAAVPPLIGSTGRGEDTALRGITKLIYSNPLSVEVPLTVTFLNVAGETKQLWTPGTNGKVGANATAVFDFGRPVTLPLKGTRFKHLATPPKTTTTSEIKATGNETFTVTSAAAFGLPAGVVTNITFQVDSEIMGGTYPGEGNTITITARKQSGTAEAKHVVGATISLLTPGISCGVIGEW